VANELERSSTELTLIEKLQKQALFGKQKHKAHLARLAALKEVPESEEYRMNLFDQMLDDLAETWTAHARLGELLGPGEEAEKRGKTDPTITIVGLDRNDRMLARQMYQAYMLGMCDEIIEACNNDEIKLKLKPPAYWSPVQKLKKINKPKPIFEYFLYNIWSISEGDNKDFFGHFPERFMENLLYYHTEERDLIYDPFAGSGTTIDVCERMNRYFFCSDIRPTRINIEKRSIQEGIPKIECPDLTFLDPPYWKQAKKEYSDDNNDLSNMDLDKYYDTLNMFLSELMESESKQIAIVIQPTQWRAIDRKLEDHIFVFDKMLSDKYKIVMRYLLPYSTQQYNAQQVEIAKKEKVCLSLIRDLVVWERK